MATQVPQGTAGADGPGPPALAHRVLSLVAVVALVGGTRLLWIGSIASSPGDAVLVVGSLGVALALAVTVAATSSRRVLGAADLAVLVLAALALVVRVRILGQAGTVRFSSDVGMVLQAAAQSLADGQHLYGVEHPDAFRQFVDGDPLRGTTTLDGSLVSDFGYPPLAAVLAAAVLRLAPGSPAAVVVCAGALLVTAGLMFALLPAPLRPAAALTCLLVGRLGDGYGVQAYPALVALPFLVVALTRWPSLGTGGTLGRRGVLSAACLGLAAASHQLAWFVVPFLVAGLWLVRRGHLPARTASLLVARYLAVAAAAFAVADAWFVVQDPAAWLRGITEPLTQQAPPHGLGLVTLSVWLTDGSGDLGWFNRASLVMLVGLGVAFVLFVRRLGGALAVLPWCGFWLANRSAESYYVALVPLWVVGVAAVRDGRGLERAYRIALPGNGVGRVATAAVLPLVAVGCAVAGLGTPPPVRLADVAPRLTPDGALWAVDATVTNRSGATVRPHFVVTTDSQTAVLNWWVLDGPASLAPGASARYTVASPTAARRPALEARLFLRVMTVGPPSMAVTAVPRGDEPLNAAVLGPLRPDPLRPGEPYRFTLQLRDRFGRDVRRGGEPLTLAVVGAGSGRPVPAVVVDGAPLVDGRTTLTTGPDGSVDVTVVADRPLDEPVLVRTVEPPTPGPLVLLWR